MANRAFETAMNLKFGRRPAKGREGTFARTQFKNFSCLPAIGLTALLWAVLAVVSTDANPALEQAGKVASQPGEGHHAKYITSLSNVFYLGDSYLEDGNTKSLNNGKGFEFLSNGPPWCTLVNLTLGLPAKGRWTAEGSKSPFGNNYAVSGAAITLSPTQKTNTSFHGQLTQLLADHPQGLPSHSLVVVSIGSNDVQAAVLLGGIWSNSSLEWKVGGAGFTIPRLGAKITIPVNSTSGLTPGPTNLVAFTGTQKAAAMPAMFVVNAVDEAGKTVTLTNKYAFPDAKVDPDSTLEISGKWFIDQSLKGFEADLKTLIAQHQHIVIVLPHPTDMMPYYYHNANRSITHAAWKYLYDRMRTLVSENSAQVQSFDLGPVMETVFSNPGRYGFKYNYPGWQGAPGVDPNLYMFWDAFHPSGAMHQYIARQFLSFLRTDDLVQTK